VAKSKNKGKALGRASIGIDVGGTKTLLALFDSHVQVLAELKFRTHPEKGGIKAFERALREALRQLLAEAAKRRLEVRSIGVGCAGDIDLRRGVVRSSRSPSARSCSTTWTP